MTDNNSNSDEEQISAIKNLVQSTERNLRPRKNVTHMKKIKTSPKQLSAESSRKRKLSAIVEESSEQNGASETSTDEDALTIAEFVKRKRKKLPPLTMDDVPSDLQEIMKMSGLDELLEQKAKKIKLTATHVKNIIKQVVTNPEVNTFLKNISVGKVEDTSLIYEPKCTRAKAKELLEQSLSETGESIPNLLQLSNSDLTYPELLALTTEDFPEEDDGDDYNPADDDEGEKSEDEVTIPSASIPGTPSTPAQEISLNTPSTNGLSGRKHKRTPSLLRPKPMFEALGNNTVHRNLDFSKPPDRTEELIYSRTRSKYPMTDTPVEYFEMNFKPPDITQDMYNSTDFDKDYAEFLREYAMPSEVAVAEDDENSDPDFNVMGQYRITKSDIREEIRNDRGVNVSLKEYSEMMTDLQCDLYDLNSNSSSKSSEINHPELNIENGFFNTYNLNFSCETPRCDSVNSYRNNCHTPLHVSQAKEDNIPENYDFVIESPVLPPENIEPTPLTAPIMVNFMIPRFSPQQLHILKVQMMQHVQLLTSSILLCHRISEWNDIATRFRKMLNELCASANESGNVSDSIYNPWNLRASIDTLAVYDKNQHIDDKYTDEVIGRKKSFTKLLKHVFLQSYAFPFIGLLPLCKYRRPLSIRSQIRNKRQADSNFVNGEEWLVAQALHRHLSTDKYKILLGAKAKKILTAKMRELSSKIYDEGIIIKSAKAIYDRICFIRNQFKYLGKYADNPILNCVAYGIYVDNPRVPKIPQFTPCPLKNVPEKCNLPPFWLKYKAEYWARNHTKTPEESSAAIDDVVDERPLYMIVYPNTNTASLTGNVISVIPLVSNTVQLDNQANVMYAFPEPGLQETSYEQLSFCAVTSSGPIVGKHSSVQSSSAPCEPVCVNSNTVVIDAGDITVFPTEDRSQFLECDESHLKRCISSPTPSAHSAMDMPMLTEDYSLQPEDKESVNKSNNSTINFSLGAIVEDLHLSDMPILMETPVKTITYMATQSIQTPSVDCNDIMMNTPVKQLDEAESHVSGESMAAPDMTTHPNSRPSKASSVLRDSENICTQKYSEMGHKRSTNKKTRSNSRAMKLQKSNDSSDEENADEPDSHDETTSEVDFVKHELDYDECTTTDVDSQMASPIQCSNEAVTERAENKRSPVKCLRSGANSHMPRSTSKLSRSSKENNSDFSLSFLNRAKEILIPTHSSVFNKLLYTLKLCQSNRESPEALYLKVEKIFKNFPLLANEFLLFLKPHQADRISKYAEYCTAVRLNNFVNKLRSHSVIKEQVQLLVELIRMAIKEKLSSKGIGKIKSEIAPKLKCPRILESFDKCFCPPPPISNFAELANEHLGSLNQNGEPSEALNSCFCMRS